MHKFNLKMMLAVASAAALVAGCGGRDDDPVVPPVVVAPVDPSTQTGQSVQKTFDYIASLVANGGENGDAVDISAITLAVDDTAEPSAI